MWVSVHSYCLDLVCVHQNGSTFPLGSLLGYDIMLWPRPKVHAPSTGATPLLRGQRTEEISEAPAKQMRNPFPPDAMFKVGAEGRRTEETIRSIRPKLEHQRTLHRGKGGGVGAQRFTNASDISFVHCPLSKGVAPVEGAWTFGRGHGPRFVRPRSGPQHDVVPKQRP